MTRIAKIISTIGLASFVFGGIFQISCAESIRPSKILLNSFAVQCPQVVTRDVGASLASLQALNSIIQEIKSDNDCAGVSQMANVVSRYASLYEDFQTQNSEVQNKLITEKKIALYTTLLEDQTLDPTQKAFVKSEIISAQTTLIEINAGIGRFKSFSSVEARSANQVVLAVDNFLSNLNTSPLNGCYKKHGARISAILSNALLTTSAFATGGTSLALASGAVITTSLEKYISNFSYEKTLEGVNDIEMPTALRCVSQVLTDQYCAASETQRLIQERIINSNRSQARFAGIDLLGYQLTSLSKWLEGVYAGSEITSQGDLINREKPILQYEFLKKIRRYIETYGTIRKKSFLTIDGDKALSNAIAQSIQGLALIMDEPTLNPKERSMFSGGGSDLENPIYATNTKSLIAFNLYKPGEVTTVPDCGFGPCSLTDYLNKKGVILNINNWEEALSNAQVIIQGALDRVNVDRAKTISVDAYSILVDARRELKGELNPLQGLQKIKTNADRIINYLTDLGCKSESENCEGINNKYFAQINNVQKTKELTNQIITLINEASVPRSLPDDVLPLDCKKNKSLMSFAVDDDIFEKKSFQITSCVSKILKLDERGTDVYFSKIRNMVSYEMEARLANGDLGAASVDIINSTKNDLVQSILNSYTSNDSSVSIGELQIGLETAQNNSMQTLNLFFDFFKKELLASLQGPKLTTSEKYDLCFRSLPFLGEEKQNVMKDIYEACKEAKFNVYKDGPLIRYSEFVEKIPGKGLRTAKYALTAKADLRARYCAYGAYNRSNLLLDSQIKQRRRQQAIR